MSTIPDMAAPGKPDSPNRYRTLTILDALVDAPDVTGRTLLVAVALLRHADAEGRCYPSISTLCRKTGTARKTVIRAIEELERGDWIEVTRTFGKVSSYQFPPDTGVPRKPVSPGNRTSATGEPVPVSPGNSKGSFKGHKEGAQVSTSRPRKRRAQGDEPTDPRVQPTLKAFFEAYRTRTGKPPAKKALDHGRAGKEIKNLPAEYTAEDLAHAVDRFFDPATPGYISKNLTWGDFMASLGRLVSGDLGTQPGPVRDQPRRVRYGPEQDHDPHHWDDWHDLGGDRNAG